VEKERNSRERKESPASGDPFINPREHRGLGSTAGIQGSDGPLEKDLLAGGGGNGKTPRTEEHGRIDGMLDGRVPEHVNAGERTDGRKRKTPCEPVTDESVVHNASINRQSGVNPDLEALNRNAPVTL